MRQGGGIKVEAVDRWVVVIKIHSHYFSIMKHCDHFMYNLSAWQLWSEHASYFRSLPSTRVS